MKKLGLIAKIGVKLSNASPEILVGAGIATMVAGAIVAVKSTKKANDILQEQAEKHDNIVENHSEEEQQLLGQQIIENDTRKENRRRDAGVQCRKNAGTDILRNTYGHRGRSHPDR